MSPTPELPDNFKFIFAAVLISVSVATLVYGGLSIAGLKADHNTGILFILPLVIAIPCGVLCLFQLPGAVRAWRSRPELRTPRGAVILACGMAMAVGAIAMIVLMVS
jgi:hypothetical protein